VLKKKFLWQIAVYNFPVVDNFASEFPFDFALEKTIHSCCAIRNRITIKEVLTN